MGEKPLFLSLENREIRVDFKGNSCNLILNSQPLKMTPLKSIGSFNPLLKIPKQVNFLIFFVYKLAYCVANGKAGLFP